MREFINSLLIASLVVLFLPLCSSAESWRKVVDTGFGNPSNDYAWSMATFKGKLYVGTLNSLQGAEIWSSSTGEPRSWDRVYKTPVDTSWGVRYLYSDNDESLYACLFNIMGAVILKTENGRRWVTVARGGLGNRNNYTVRCMTRFRDYLYAGAGSNMAQLYRSKNGFNWELVNANPDFGSTKVIERPTGIPVTNNLLIGELAVFNGQLYAFTWTTDFNIQGMRGAPATDRMDVQAADRMDVQKNPVDFETRDLDPFEFVIPTPGAFEVWRSYDGENWEKVVGLDDAYGNGMGFCLHDSENLDNDAVTSTAVFRGQLYLGTESASSNSSVWRTSDGTRWEKVLDFFDLAERHNRYIWRMIPFGNRLFIGTFNSGMKIARATGAQIWASSSGDPGSFDNLVRDGFDGETTSVYFGQIPKNYGIRSFGIVRGNLFAGTATILSIMEVGGKPGVMGQTVGCEIWELTP
ncbi:MAG: hypothetical protein AB1847_15260 [bacterium]